MKNITRRHQPNITTEHTLQKNKLKKQKINKFF